MFLHIDHDVGGMYLKKCIGIMNIYMTNSRQYFVQDSAFVLCLPFWSGRESKGIPDSAAPLSCVPGLSALMTWNMINVTIRHIYKIFRGTSALVK